MDRFNSPDPLTFGGNIRKHWNIEIKNQTPLGSHRQGQEQEQHKVKYFSNLLKATRH